MTIAASITRRSPGCRGRRCVQLREKYRCTIRARPGDSFRAMTEIGYTRSTDSRYRVPLEHTVPQRLRTTSHWSKPHRIRTQPHVHRVHPIMAEQVLEMYPSRIQATRLWPDYSTTSPHAHTHHVTRQGIGCSFIS